MGIILFILFFGVAAFVGYVYWRWETVPIGKKGLLSFLNARTRKVYDEGGCVVHLFCKLELLDVSDQVVKFESEDVGCGDGFKIVHKVGVVRYRLGQIIPIGSVKRFGTSLYSLYRRIVPYTMPSQAAEFLSMKNALDTIREKAQQEVSTFCGSRPHTAILGYHVIRFVDNLIKEDGVVDITPDERVKATRNELMDYVKRQLAAEFESLGLEIVSVTISDFDPSEKVKAHIEEAQEKIREIQVRRLQTSAEVDRAIQLALADVKLMAEHPGATLATHYTNMRQLDNNQTGAESAGVIGQLLLAFLNRLQPTPAQPSSPKTPAEEKAA